MQTTDSNIDAIIISIMAFVVLCMMLIAFILAVLKTFDKAQLKKIKEKL